MRFSKPNPSNRIFLNLGESALAGKVHLHVRPPSLTPFLENIKSQLESFFPEGDPRLVVGTLSSDALLTRMKQIRDQIMLSQESTELLCPVWQELGFSLEDLYFDAIRIRCVPDRYHENPEAISVSYIHRDPWYANPQCQLNLWIPIYDVKKDAGFRIYPKYFTNPIPNNSNLFDYNEWMEMGGFQANQTPVGKTRIFPSPKIEPMDNSTIDVFGESGELTLFSSHHLHGTSANVSGIARFSLEVRFVCYSHLEQKKGPLKLDNQSIGSTLIDMKSVKADKKIPLSLIQEYEDFFALQ